MNLKPHELDQNHWSFVLIFLKCFSSWNSSLRVAIIYIYIYVNQERLKLTRNLSAKFVNSPFAMILCRVSYSASILPKAPCRRFVFLANKRTTGWTRMLEAQERNKPCFHWNNPCAYALKLFNKIDLYIYIYIISFCGLCQNDTKQFCSWYIYLMGFTATHTFDGWVVEWSFWAVLAQDAYFSRSSFRSDLALPHFCSMLSRNRFSVALVWKWESEFRSVRRPFSTTQLVPITH